MFNKIRSLVGGRIRLICCGAAPFPKVIYCFFVKSLSV
jgi:long-subunit acyl-CoA synthetase (AMP-forming)